MPRARLGDLAARRFYPSAPSMTLLVFLAAATRTGIVASDLARALARALGTLVRFFTSAAVGELLHLLLAQLDVLYAIDIGDVVRLQTPLHLLEDVEALPLVLHQWVALGETAPADPLAQVVHLVEVLPPAGIDYREQRPALGLLERGHPVPAREPALLEFGGPLIPLGLALLEALPGVFEDHGEHLRGRQGLDVERVEVDGARIEAVHLGGEGLQIPVFGVDVFGDVLGDDV